MTAGTDPDKTWDDLKEFINGELPRDAVMDDAVYARRINIAIDIINSICSGFEGYWNNDPNDSDYGTLSLSGSTCTFPNDLKEARQIHWNHYELHFRTVEWLERLDPRWRTRSGNPSFFTLTARGIVLDSNPNNDTGGPLEVWGEGCMPHLSLDAGSLNPFAYLPLPHQMAPAFYVLGHLPYFGRTREEVVAIQTDYRGQWQFHVDQLAWGEKLRKFPPMTS